MLLRLVVKNLFSFKELTEFNTAPGRFSRLPHHVYKTAGIEVLKLNAVYGANGAGKSNMIRVLDLLQDYLNTGNLPLGFITGTYKFDPESKDKDVYIGVEFIKDDNPYYYGITINRGIVIEEELLLSGLGKQDDQALFRRTDGASLVGKQIELHFFSPEVLNDQEAALYPSFLQNEILGRNKPVLFYMKTRQNPVFDLYRRAAEWFVKDLVIILPDRPAIGLVFSLEDDPKFEDFAQEVLRSFNTGISSIGVETLSLEEYFGKDNRDEISRTKAVFAADPEQVHEYQDQDIVTLLMHEGNVVAKRLYFLHEDSSGATRFAIGEESDGTRRLIDFLPLFYNVVNSQRTYIIDEIERSIHPLMIKELVRKFSHDPNTKGQLIFSTHESNLLDQDIFRPDEIWFAEKNKEGATELTTLSEFREHHTIDIRKGYLAGRYGGIPFLGNLKDLNWDKYAETDPV